MKFVQIGDLHLDMPFVSLNRNQNLIKRRKLEQRYALKKVIEYILDNKIELLFITGDLFEQKYVTEDTINYLIYTFKQIPQTKIYITPGNHDPLIKNSPYLLYEWPENVFIFGGEVGLDNYQNVNIYGVGFDDYFVCSKDIGQIDIEKDKVNILITHGTLNGASHKYNDIKIKDLEKFDFVALGHIHMPKVDTSNIIYSGSLASCGFDEPGEHGMIVGEIKDDLTIYNEKGARINSGIVKYKFIKIDDTEFKELVLDISQFTSTQELLDNIKIDDQNIYEIKLVGERKFEIEEAVNSIKSIYQNVCKIKNETHKMYNYNEISKEDTLKGNFVKKMLQKMNEDSNNKELYLDALEYVLDVMKG